MAYNKRKTVTMARILIIDDDNEFREMVREILIEADFNSIEEAVNGGVGMKLLRQQSFDLVITDIVMPEKEGIETIIELNRDYPGIKIIAMSGGGKRGNQNYLEMAQYLGASRILAKPFQRSDLIKTVKELLHK